MSMNIRTTNARNWYGPSVAFIHSNGIGPLRNLFAWQRFFLLPFIGSRFLLNATNFN